MNTPENSSRTDTSQKLLDTAISSPQDSGEISRSAEIENGLRHVTVWAFRFLAIVGGIFVLTKIVGWLWTGILPVMITLIVCSILAPPVGFLVRHRWPRALAVLVTILGAFILVIGLFASLTPEVIAEVEHMVRQASVALTDLQVALHNPPFNLDDSQLDHYIQTLSIELQQRAGELVSVTLTGVSMVSQIALTTMVVLMLSFFFLKDGHKFLPMIDSTFSGTAGRHAHELLVRSWITLGGFIRAQAAVSFCNSVVTAIGLIALGIPLALPLAVLNFFSGFIPIFGAIVAGLIAVIVAGLSKGLISALLVLGLVLIVHQLEGNILSPFFQSRAMKLHPVIILASIAVGGGLFGVVGAFLAVPIAAVVATIFRYINEYIDAHITETVSAPDGQEIQNA